MKYLINIQIRENYLLSENVLMIETFPLDKKERFHTKEEMDAVYDVLKKCNLSGSQNSSTSPHSPRTHSNQNT